MILDYTAVDIETTGINSKRDRIIEIGAVKVRNGIEKETFSRLINPGRKLPEEIIKLTGISDEMMVGEDTIDNVLPEFIEFCGEDIILGHNIIFDYGFIKQNAANMNIAWQKYGIDTLKITRKLLPDIRSHRLDYLCLYYNIEDDNHHRALNDASVTSRIYQILAEQFGGENADCFKPRELIYSVKKQSPVTKRQCEYLTALLNYHNLRLEQDINSLTKSEASRIIDKILSEKGRI